MKFLKFIFIGILFSAPIEFWNQIINLKNGWVAFFITMVIYSVLLIIGYLINNKIEKLDNKFLTSLIYFLFFGFLGLLVEWVLLGNSNVFFLGQMAMFSFWAGMVFLPKIFFAIYAPAIIIFSMIGGPSGGWPTFLIGQLLIYYFYIKYFLITRRA